MRPHIWDNSIFVKGQMIMQYNHTNFEGCHNDKCVVSSNSNPLL
jgi:hypothetical protein